MNKQELIKKYKNKCLVTTHFESMEMFRELWKDIKQLDEPQKVVVPQFVADWYEENKDDFEGNLFRCAHNIPSIFDGAKLNEFERWFLNASTKPFQTLVNMHQLGYEVEKEKQYEVSIKASGQYLARNKLKEIKFMFNGACSHFTRKELEEAEFGWVFDCPGIEIEEVL